MTGILNLLMGTVRSAVVTDPYFEYTTLLLPGSGTNGTQNNSFVDSSANAFPITRNPLTGPNAPTQGTFSPFSQTGWGNYFDGTGDSLSLADNTAFRLGTNSFTMEGWIYLTAYSPIYFGSYYGVTLCAKETAGSRSFYFTLNATASSYTGLTLGLCVSADTFTTTTGTFSFALNTWYHIAAVRNGTTATLYVNGTSIGSNTNSTNVNVSTTPLTIGQDGFGQFEYYLPGYISNFRLVNGVAVYTGNFTPPTTPLAATQSAGTNISALTGTQTTILTCQSNRFIDNSTNNFTITRNGDTRVVAFSPFNPTASWSAATYGGSGYFDGSGDYLSVADNAAFDFGTGDYTVELWIYRNNTTGDMAVLDGRSGSTGYLLYLNASNKLIWYVNAGVITGSTTIGSSQWYHIAISRVGTAVKLFVNGVEDGSATNSTSTDSTGLAIGAKNTASSIVDFNGYISNVRLLKGTGYSTITVPTAPLTAITNTSLLLNFTNAGVYDATSKNDLETVGNAQISTAQYKFPPSSMSFDGTTDYLVEPTSVYFGYGTGDFTIEFWVYFNSTGTSTIFSNLSGTASTNPHIYINSTIRFYNGGGDRITSSTSPSTGVWYHLAVCRASGSTRMFLNGTQTGSTYADTNDYGQSAPLGVGTYWNGGAPVTASTLNGYLQDVRVSKYARYTTNFTPPTAAFPTL